MCNNENISESINCFSTGSTSSSMNYKFILCKIGIPFYLIICFWQAEINSIASDLQLEFNLTTKIKLQRLLVSKTRGGLQFVEHISRSLFSLTIFVNVQKRYFYTIKFLVFFVFLALLFSRYSSFVELFLRSVLRVALFATAR